MENGNNLDALTKILTALNGLDSETQKRTLQAVITFLGLELPSSEGGYSVKFNTQNENISPVRNEVTFSENRSISPKEFLRDKTPQTDIERVACLGYYLTHYKDLPHFKTIDISKLNTEAAQPKLSNPTTAVDNATKAGLLVQASRGNKQMSAAGEHFVQLLPDRISARESLKSIRVRRKTKKPIPKKNKSE